jgi:four helix bundle protein
LQDSKEFVISNQLLRSGTSIGANIEEALQGQSKADFIAKLSISLKEAHETKYWLKLLKFGNLSNINVDVYLTNIDEIINILTRIIKTTKEKK